MLLHKNIIQKGVNMSTQESQISTKAREPNREEKHELTVYSAHQMVSQPTDHELTECQALVERAYVAVFDDYVTDSPGYAGRVMVVVWAGGPEYAETFIWQDGQLTPVRSNLCEVTETRFGGSA
jgi:hypothetical protein